MWVGWGGENCLDDELALLLTLQVHAQSSSSCSKLMQECPNRRAHGIQMYAHMQKTADYQRTLILFVVSSVKLYFTA